MIEILACGALTTVQDLGRRGALRWGVGTAGAMDPVALAAGNLLLGNAADAAAVELPVFPLRLRFHRAMGFAVTGADAQARLAGRPLLPWAAHQARAGDELVLGRPQPGRGSRAYLCVPGGLDLAPVLGSRSTQLRGAFGGLQGRPLQPGDRLAAAAPAQPVAAGRGVLPPALALPLQHRGLPAVRVMPAAEYPAYTDDSQQRLWQQPWKITPQSDRYGYRLAGAVPLQARRPLEMRSHGIVPGVIQVPPDGQPIVQMRDAQPTGGYPKVGAVIEADLWRLGQAPIGSLLHFVPVDWAEALAAQQALDDWLQALQRQLALGAPARQPTPHPEAATTP